MDNAYCLTAPTNDHLLTDGHVIKNTAATTTIYIEHGRFIRNRGQTYNARLDSPTGDIIVRDRHDVEYAACRELLARGVSGRLFVRRSGKAYADMLIRDIGKAAKLTVVEGAATGPRLGRYSPAPVDLIRSKTTAEREVVAA